MAKVKVDLTGVEAQTIIPEGRYAAKIIKAEEDTNGAGNDQIVVTFEITKGPEKGSKIKNFFVLVDTALWKLKELLIALGMKSDGKIAIDLDKMVGKACDITIYTDEYNGTERSRISNYTKAGPAAKAEVEDDDDEDEKPKKKPGRKPKKVEVEDDDEDEEDDEEEESEDDDEDDAVDYSTMKPKELQTLAKERKIKGWKDLKGKKLIKALEQWDEDNAADDDDDDWDDDDD